MKPTIGTISHGTLRHEDLIPAFARELRRLCGTNPRALELVEQVEKVDLSEGDAEVGDDLEVDLADALDEIASQHGLRFGSHEGDGSDFGFWPTED